MKSKIYFDFCHKFAAHRSSMQDGQSPKVRTMYTYVAICPIIYDHFLLCMALLCVINRCMVSWQINLINLSTFRKVAPWALEHLYHFPVPLTIRTIPAHNKAPHNEMDRLWLGVLMRINMLRCIVCTGGFFKWKWSIFIENKRVDRNNTRSREITTLDSLHAQINNNNSSKSFTVCVQYRRSHLHSDAKEME